MGYNKENYRRIKSEYSQKYLKAQQAADNRKFALYEKIPGLRELDRMLACAGPEIMSAVIGDGNDTEAKVQKIRERNSKMLAERKALLEAYGYPEDYTDVHYECEKCGDTGYVDTKMCDCMKRALILAGYESSGIAGLMQTQNFKTFSLDYYSRANGAYDNMKRIYEKMMNFAAGFNVDTYKNYLFMGGTGLGKTHLSTAVAKDVIDRGFDVLYVCAAGMIGDFEYRRFGNSTIDGEAGSTSRYYTADLLIIDDLGTEVINQFTVSCLYDVINSRIIRRRSTIISTNLNQDEIRQKYWDRITSRLFGEYLPMAFFGDDVRKQKVKNGNIRPASKI